VARRGGAAPPAPADLPAVRTGGLVADLPAPWAGDLFLREDQARWDLARSWSTGDASLLDVRPVHGGRAAVGVGDPATLAAWLAALASGPDRPEPTRASLARGTWAMLPEEARRSYGLLPFSEWDWLVCDRPPGPPGPGEERVLPLEDAEERAAARELLAIANPTTPTTPDDPATLWWGWADGVGRLRGVVGGRRVGAGGPLHLGGIGTDPGWRGQGVASALTAAVLRQGLASAPWVSLGVRVGNDPARRVYRRLGFRCIGAFETLRAPGHPPR
jgi:ribosomal protein S18 acetylase RimI-like enzyme